jgi:hypothetical protein
VRPAGTANRGPRQVRGARPHRGPRAVQGKSEHRRCRAVREDGEPVRQQRREARQAGQPVPRQQLSGDIGLAAGTEAEQFQPGRGWRATWLPAAVAVAAVVPLIPLPYQTAPVSAVPAGWQAAFARLRLEPDARVLVVPIPNVGHSMAMRWQADTGEPG